MLLTPNRLLVVSSVSEVGFQHWRIFGRDRGKVAARTCLCDLYVTKPDTPTVDGIFASDLAFICNRHCRHNLLISIKPLKNNTIWYRGKQLLQLSAIVAGKALLKGTSGYKQATYGSSAVSGTQIQQGGSKTECNKSIILCIVQVQAWSSSGCCWVRVLLTKRGWSKPKKEILPIHCSWC